MCYNYMVGGFLFFKIERGDKMSQIPITSTIRVKEVDLHATRACGHCCDYCYVAPNDPKTQTVVNSCGPLHGDTKTLKRVIEAIHDTAGAEDLVFVGGDPCRHPDLVSLLEHAKEVGLNVCVLSNTHTYMNGGHHVDIAAIKDLLDEVDFTLHGDSPEAHNAFTKRPESYERAIVNIGRFMRVRGDDQPVGIVLNMIPDTIRNLPSIMENIAGELQMKPGLDFFTIQRIAPSGKALENFGKWRIDRTLVERAFETFEDVRAQYGLETKVCIDAFPWCAVPEKYWGYLEPLRGGCNWGKPGGVLSALMTGELQRCALCQSTLGVNILDLKGPEDFSNFMLTHPVLKATNDKQHLGDKCRSCSLLERCGGGCIVSAGAEKGDPYRYENGVLSVCEGCCDYLAR